MAQETTDTYIEGNNYMISAQSCGIIDCHSDRKDLRHARQFSLIRIGQKSEYPHLGAHRSIIKLETGSYQSFMQNEILRQAHVSSELRNAYGCLVQGHTTPWKVSAIHVCAREISFMMRSSENEGKNPLSNLVFPLHALEDDKDFYLNIMLQPRNWPWPKVNLCIHSTILESSLLRCTTVTEYIGKHRERITGFTEYPNGDVYVNVLTKISSKSH